MSFSTNLNSDHQMGALGAAEFGEADHPDLVKARKTIEGLKKDEIKEGQEKAQVVSKPTVETSGIGAKKSRLPSSKDISSDLEQSVKEESTKRIETGKPTLFSTWEGDKLSVYMCEAGSLILLLSFQLRQSLSEAQLIEAKNQMDSAEKSAELRRKQGEADKKRLYNDAMQGIVSGSVGLASFSSGVYDTMKARPQEQQFMGHDKMNIELNQGLERQVNANPELVGERARPGVVEHETTTAPVDKVYTEITGGEEPQRTTFGDRAEAYGEELKSKYNEKLKEYSADTEARDEYIKKNIGGIDQKGYEEVAGEYEMRCQRKASRDAWEHLETQLGSERGDFNKALRDDPQVAHRFMKGAGVDQRPDAVMSMFSSRDMVKEYPLGEGTEKVNFKSEIMKSFGASRETSSNAAHQGRASSDIFRDKVASERQHSEMKMRREEGRYNERRNHRMLISETINGFTKAGTGWSSADQMVEAANAEGHAKEMDTIAQLNGAARSSQDSTIMSALEKVVSFFREMADAKAQMASALNASLSA